jgi:cobalt-zinc-cadmium efflux system membrane fusion protein
MKHIHTYSKQNTLQSTPNSPVTGSFRWALLSAVIVVVVGGLSACGQNSQNSQTSQTNESPSVASSNPSSAAKSTEDGSHGAKSNEEGLALSPEETQRAGIKVERVKQQTVTDTITVTANIYPNQEKIVRIAPRVEGRIVSISARLGDQVRAGQVLARLDSPVLGEASLSLIQARSNYRIAQADFNRADLLNKEEIIPQKDFLKAKADLERASAELRVAESKLRLLGVSPQAEETVETTFPLVAPFAGTIIQQKATVGELSNPNEPLFTVANLSKVWVEANLTEPMLAKVKKGTKATVTVAAYPGEVFVGKVTYISSVVNKDANTVAARIEINNEKGRLKPDMFATAVIDVKTDSSISSAAPTQAIMVPDEAIVLLQGQPVVFVAHDGRYEQRAVELGDKLTGRTIVKSGLNVDEDVVISGTYELKARLLKSQIGDAH